MNHMIWLVNFRITLGNTWMHTSGFTEIGRGPFSLWTIWWWASLTRSRTWTTHTSSSRQITVTTSGSLGCQLKSGSHTSLTLGETNRSFEVRRSSKESVLVSPCHRVPLMIRGPGIAPGTETGAQFNRKNFGLKNHLSFGLILHYIQKENVLNWVV